jgi:hypothetical protein
MKNRIKIILVAFAVISSIIVTSCKKYDEGGLLKNSEDVLTKEWSMEKAFKNGASKEVISANPQIGEVTENWTFNDNGNCSTEDGNSTLTGTWTLSNDSKSLTVDITSPTSKASTQTYSIIKMTKGSDGQMIWEHTIGSDEYRYELRSSL